MTFKKGGDFYDTYYTSNNISTGSNNIFNIKRNKILPSILVKVKRMKSQLKMYLIDIIKINILEIKPTI